jgi:Lipase maturation factor
MAKCPGCDRLPSLRLPCCHLVPPDLPGFLAIFLGNSRSTLPVLLLWLLRWLLLRLEFGAGLIKLRGDPCWRDLTRLRCHHETQPMPGPLSWFHHVPDPLHRVEVLANYVAQLAAPLALFAPQLAASVAAAVVIVTQLWLVASGNFAWLDWLTIVIACSVVDTSLAGHLVPLPYHLRLDWLMWFAALSPAYAEPWLSRLLHGLLTGDWKCSGYCGPIHSPASRRPGSGSAATGSSSRPGGSSARPAPGGNEPRQACTGKLLRCAPPRTAPADDRQAARLHLGRETDRNPSGMSGSPVTFAP